MSKKQEKYFRNFSKNLQEGALYYSNLFEEVKGKFEETKASILSELEASKNDLLQLNLEIEQLVLQKVSL